MKITSRGEFHVGQRVSRKDDMREGVVLGIKDMPHVVKGALDFALTVQLDGNTSPTCSNAVFFEPAVTRDR